MIWQPVSDISDALDAGFYNAYGAVEPANKSTLLALDISGSMGWTRCSGLPLTPREATAALSMVTAAVEPEYRIVGFSSAAAGSGTLLRELDISPRRRLDDIVTYMDGLPFGATDCALPMVWALRNKVKIETFQIYTDNETWFGSIHPHQALKNYRDQMGIDARLAVIAMTSGGASIADPTDAGSLDVSGFDSVVPTLLSDFSAGRI
jgi:60 kDa SS-A/Ro ribonucleoprotein